MTEVASKKPHPRPPSAGTAAPHAASKKEGCPTAELLRRRLAQAEMHLREMQDEARRITTHQSRELEVVQSEHSKYLERVELLRMEECMTTTEIEAVKADANASAGLSSSEGKRTSSAGAKAVMNSKLLASNSPRYCEARDSVLQKRIECAEAEAKLAALRNKLAGLRSSRNQMHRETQGSVYAATVRQSRVARMQSQSREQMRGLEVHLTEEQEQLSAMVADAKRMRSEIDTLLITQSRFEKTYRQREDELLEKKKQMSFLIEVCTLLFEEREQRRREIEELQELSTEESRKYETALDELDGVLLENKRSQQELDEKLVAARQELRETRKSRLATEKRNAAAKEEIQRNKELWKQRQRSLVDTTASSPSRGASVTSGRDQHPPAHRLNDVDGAANANESSTADDNMTEAQNQIHQLDLFYERLAELAGSDRLDDVVSYIDVSAEERFRFFSELNYLQEELASLEKEKAVLLGVAAEDANRNPKSLLAQVIAMDEAEAAAAGHGENGDDDDGKALTAKRVAAESALRAQRAREMEKLQETLNLLTLRNIEEGEDTETLDQTFDKLLESIKQMFLTLGCDSDVVRGQSGSEKVLRTNVTDCLALIEQRVEEYLLALARGEHLLLRDADSAEQPQPLPPQGPQKHSVARTFLRRPDLPPPVTPEGDGEADGGGGAVPRFTVAHHPGKLTESLSAKQLVERTRGGLPRSVDPHPSGAATAAAIGKSSTTKLTAAVSTPLGATQTRGLGSALVGAAPRSAASLLDSDAPLSMEEMHRIVRERQGGPTHGDAESRRLL